MFDEFYPNSDTAVVKQQAAQQKVEMNFGREQMAQQIAATEYGDADSNKSDLIRWQQQLDEELETIKYTLKNYVKQGEQWVPQQIIINGEKVDSPQMLTDEGIQAVEAEVRPFMSKNLINSNLDENRIRNTLKFTCKTITRIMGYNYDSYVVDPSPQNMSHIRRVIKNNIIPGIFRSVNGWTKKQDNMVSRRVETFNDSQVGQQNAGKFGGLFAGK